MVDPTDIFLGGILPGLVAAAALWSVARATDNVASGWRTAAVLAFVVGLWALDARGAGVVTAVSKSVRIQEAKDFLPLLVILAILPDMVASYGRRANIVAWVLRVTLCIGVPWRLLYGSPYLPSAGATPNPFDTRASALSLTEAVFWIGSTGALVCGVWASWRTQRTEQPWLRTALVAAVFLSGAVVLALSGSLTQGQLLGILTATVTGCLLSSVLGRFDRGPDAAAGPMIVACGGVLLLATFFAELKPPNAVLLLLAMAIAGGWCLPKYRHAAAVRLVACLLLAGAAVTSAALDFAATQADDPYSQFMN